MNDNHLYDLYRDRKWDEIREFLDSDSNNNKDKEKLVVEVVRYRGRNVWTCLHAACYKKPPVDIIKSLLDIGGKELVLVTTNRKYTALHYACSNNASLDVIKMLIDLGGKGLVVAKNDFGNTALHYLCEYIKNRRHTKTANTIKLMLQVSGTETILTEKNDNGKTPLDYATAKGASDEIKALLRPRNINNDPANTNDDASNLVPDDRDSNNTTTELQNQLQAAYQKIAHLESQQAEHVLLATRHQDQLQAANQKIVDLGNVNKEQKAENVLLSEQKATAIEDQAACQKKIKIETQHTDHLTAIEDQAAYQNKIADLEDKIENQQTAHLTTIAYLSKETKEEKARQHADITHWKGRVENLTEICSELKVELQQLKASSRNQDQIHAANNQTIADLENEIVNQNVLLSEQVANRFQDQSADQNISNLEEKHVLLSKISNREKNNLVLSEQKAEQEKETAYWKGRVNNLIDICSELKIELQQLKDSTRVSVAHVKRECDTDDGIDSAATTQSCSSKRSRVG